MCACVCVRVCVCVHVCVCVCKRVLKHAYLLCVCMHACACVCMRVLKHAYLLCVCVCVCVHACPKTRVSTVASAVVRQQAAAPHLSLCLLTLGCDGVHLVDEDNGGGVLLSLLEDLHEWGKTGKGRGCHYCDCTCVLLMCTRALLTCTHVLIACTRMLIVCTRVLHATDVHSCATILTCTRVLL